MISINPYLVYKGTCEEAFIFYKMIFGAENLHISRYQDVPPEARVSFPKANEKHVLHATLQIDRNTTIMGNDSPDAENATGHSFARDFYIYMDVDNPTEAVRIFNELSRGGTVIVPIAETFWSSCYGVLTDKFGIHWKVTSHNP